MTVNYGSAYKILSGMEFTLNLNEIFLVITFFLTAFGGKMAVLH